MLERWITLARRWRETGPPAAAAMALALLVTMAATAPQAAVLLDDFESGFDGMTGQLSKSGPVDVDQRPGMQAGMRIATVGEGACNNLVGTSKALCGADTLQFAGFDGTWLTYSVDFPRFAAVLFDVAAWSHRDPFDPWNGTNADIWGDFIRVQARLDDSWTLLAEFTGTREDGLQQTLVSTDAGLLLDGGLALAAEFTTIRLSGINDLFPGMGELRFEFRTTGSAEQVGIDNIRLAPIPLPGALGTLLLGLAALGALRLGRRA